MIKMHEIMYMFLYLFSYAKCIFGDQKECGL